MDNLTPGQLVLATRYTDGSFMDPHCVGLFLEAVEPYPGGVRYRVTWDSTNSRLYDRAEAVSEVEAKLLIELMEIKSDRSSESVWNTLLWIRDSNRLEHKAKLIGCDRHLCDIELANGELKQFNCIDGGCYLVSHRK